MRQGYPDNWIVLKIIDTLYKLFITWNGGYLYGDGWRVNSGITKITQDDDYYYIYGYSGSCYKCHKKAYGVSSFYGSLVLSKILEAGATVMNDVEDWEKLIKENGLDLELLTYPASQK